MKLVGEECYDAQGNAFGSRILLRIHRKIYDNGKIVDRFNVGIGNTICNINDLMDLVGDTAAWEFINSAKRVASRSFA